MKLQKISFVLIAITGVALAACTPGTPATDIPTDTPVVVTPTESIAATATVQQDQFSDPFAYCAAVGTIDAPDERYVGPAAPEAVTQDLRKKAGVSSDAPDSWVEAGTYWRCEDNQVWACLVGANLPCWEKPGSQGFRSDIWYELSAP